MYASRGKHVIRESKDSFSSGLYLILQINIDFFILELKLGWIYTQR